MRILLCTLLLAILPSLQATPDLDTVLSNMDRASANFQGMKAEVEWLKYTALVDDKGVDKGVIAVRREKDGGVSLLIEFRDPYHYYVAVDGTKVEIYRPKIATVEEYDLSSSKATLDQALLLAFGTAGKFLRGHYDLKVQGEEVAAGEATVKLELVPKSDDMKKKIQRIEMWISKVSWNVVRQKLYQPSSEDYRLYTYTNIALNPGLSGSDLRLKIPKRVKRVFPQR